ncbi:MAG: hypothetical protein OXG25_06680 [Gammaproteobacteria bacterium]|nr:hypothetical protein [Gammaproteobacteria bacterium]
MSAFAALLVSASVVASGNFLGLLQIREIPVEQDGQAKVKQLFSRSSAGISLTESQSFSATITLGDMSFGKTTFLQPTGFDGFYELLPFEWHVVSDKPLLHVLPEFIDYSTTREIEFVDLLRIFNIEVLVAPPHEFDYPDNATLVFKIRSLEKAIQVDLPMHLDLIQSSYFISNPDQVARELSFELERFEAVNERPGQIKPWLSIVEFKGFGLPERDDDQDNATVIPVAYQLRFGSFSVDSGFQKLGGTDASNSHFPFKPLLTN